MYLEAKIKSATPLLSKYNGLGKTLGKLEKNDQIALVSLHKYGTESYYRTAQGGYVNGADVSIIRDVDFSNERRRNSSTRGDSLFVISNYSYPTFNYSNRLNYTLVEDQRKKREDAEERNKRINGTSVTRLLRTSNSKVNEILSGATIGNVRDGSFFKTGFLKNVRNVLTNIINSRLRYVIGFDFESELSNIFDILGLTYPNLNIGGDSSYDNPYNKNNDSGDSLMYRGITYEDDVTGKIINGQYMQRQMTYAEVDEAAIKYFKYHGCDGRMIIKKFGAMYEWEQDESYATVLVTEPPVIDPNDVRIFKMMHDDSYEQETSYIDRIYKDFDMHVDRLTDFTLFNRHRLVTVDNELMGTRGHIFMTRPDMNLLFQSPEDGANVLTNDPKSKVMSAHASVFMRYMQTAHSNLMGYLMQSQYPAGPFIPIISNRVTSLDISDEVLETTEHGETLTGWKNTYAQSTIKSKTANSVNLTFRDDDMLSIYKIMKVWVEYMNAVYRGEAYPNVKLSSKRILDYAVSIYYFLTKTTGEDILYWCKFTGCFPTAAPTSNFSDSSTESASATYTVPFQYAKKDDVNPVSIVEFNNLTKDDPFRYMPTYDPNTMHGSRSFVGQPFVDTATGGYIYKLKFRPPADY